MLLTWNARHCNKRTSAHDATNQPKPKTISHNVKPWKRSINGKSSTESRWLATKIKYGSGLKKRHNWCLTRWNQNTAHATYTKSKAAQEQDTLGWDLSLEGAVSKQWSFQQEAHWKMYKSRKSSKQWTTKLLKKLMNIVWDMWQQRNQALHNKPENRALILKSKINNQVTKMYHLSPGAFIMGVTLMKCLLSELLQWPWAYKKTGSNWQR